MGEGNRDKSKKKKKKRGGAKRRMTVEQTSALKSVNEWVYLAQHADEQEKIKEDDFLPEIMRIARVSENIVFELHSHTICSDGFLSPSALVEKAHQNGVSFASLISFLFFEVLYLLGFVEKKRSDFCQFLLLVLYDLD